MLSCAGKRSHRHTILHVSFSNSFGLASARPTPQGLSGAPEIVKILVERGNAEIGYYESEQQRVKQLSREDAINELLKCLKLDNKISTIKQFIEQIQK